MGNKKEYSSSFEIKGIRGKYVINLTSKRMDYEKEYKGLIQVVTLEQAPGLIKNTNSILEHFILIENIPLEINQKTGGLEIKETIKEDHDSFFNVIQREIADEKSLAKLIRERARDHLYSYPSA